MRYIFVNHAGKRGCVISGINTNYTSLLVRNFGVLLKIKKQCAQNTVIHYMKCMKKITNLPLANGWITTNPFASVKFKEKKVIRNFLTINELNMLKNKEFGIPHLETVLDIFLFCCFTGLAFIDVYNLKREHIIEDAKRRK